VLELGPILRSMLRNKIAVGLLMVEIAFTMAVVVNCLNLVIANNERMSIPTGLDEEQILVLRSQPHGDAFDEDDFLRNVIDQDLALIRSQPGVVDATAMSPTPLQGGGSSTQLKAVGLPDDKLVRAPQYRLDEHFLNTLGLELVAGRNFTPDDIPPPQPPPEEGEEPPPPRFDNIIVTQDLADALYPDGDALGKQTTGVGDSEVGDTIVGIVGYMYTPYDQGASGMETRILFYPRKPGSRSGIRYLVRTEPGAFDTLFTDLEERVLSVNRDRIVSTESLMEVKRRGIFQNLIVVQILTAIIVLLLLVTSIGIFGMTSFAVTKRTRQIGTRRALGATRFAIVRLFLVENGLITAFGVGIGLVVALLINQMIVANTDNVSSLSPALIAGSLALLFGIGLLSTLVPALRGARVPPAIASRSA